MAAEVLSEGIRRAGKAVSRESLQRALFGPGRTDVGNFAVDFKPGFRHGGKFVAIAVVRRNGDLRN